MYIVWTIVLFFALWLLYDYKRGVLMLTAWILALNTLNVYGGGVTAFQFLACIACMLGVFHYYRRRRRKGETPYPFWICAIVVTISIVLTNIVCQGQHWPTKIVNIVSLYVFPFFVWFSLDGPRNMRRFVSYTVVFLILMVGYGIFEEITNSNPIIDWISENNYGTVGVSDRMRYGLKRIQSFLTYNGVLGTCCIMNVLFLAYVNANHKVYIRSFSPLVPYLIVGLYICTLFTGTRSVIFAAAVGSLYFINRRNLKSRWTWIAIVVGIIAVSFAASYFQEIYESIEDTRAVGGSSVEMREGQFGMAFDFLRQAPLFGNGIGYTSSYVIENFRDTMFGAESLWIPLMIDRGFVGILSYLIVLFVSVRYCLKLKNRAGIFIILVFVMAKTTSSIPGMSEAYFLIYVIATSRMILYKKTTNKHLVSKNEHLKKT